MPVALAQHQLCRFTAGPAALPQCPPAAVCTSELQCRPDLQRAGSGRCGQDSHAEAQRPAAPHPPGEAPLRDVGNQINTQDVQSDSRHMPSRTSASLPASMQPTARRLAAFPPATSSCAIIHALPHSHLMPSPIPYNPTDQLVQCQCHATTSQLHVLCPSTTLHHRPRRTYCPTA